MRFKLSLPITIEKSESVFYQNVSLKGPSLTTELGASKVSSAKPFSVCDKSSPLLTFKCRGTLFNDRIHTFDVVLGVVHQGLCRR